MTKKNLDIGMLENYRRLKIGFGYIDLGNKK